MSRNIIDLKKRILYISSFIKYIELLLTDNHITVKEEIEAFVSDALHVAFEEGELTSSEKLIIQDYIVAHHLEFMDIPVATINNFNLSGDESKRIVADGLVDVNQNVNASIDDAKHIAHKSQIFTKVKFDFKSYHSAFVDHIGKILVNDKVAIKVYKNAVIAYNKALIMQDKAAVVALIIKAIEIVDLAAETYNRMVLGSSTPYYLNFNSSFGTTSEFSFELIPSKILSANGDIILTDSLSISKFRYGILQDIDPLYMEDVLSENVEAFLLEPIEE